MMARTLAETSQVLGLASRACCERQLWTVNRPDAVGMAHEIEGAVESDAGSLLALLAVVLESGDKRVSWTESEIAHPAKDGHYHGRFDLLDQVRLVVIPIRGIGRATPRSGMLVDEEETDELAVLKPGDVSDRANSGAKLGTCLRNRQRTDVALDELGVHRATYPSGRLASWH
jgi:hypothetical protein